MFDRSLLSKLSLCAWNVLRQYLMQAVPYDDAIPGAVITVQTFGEFQNFNPHVHILATDGCFYGTGKSGTLYHSGILLAGTDDVYTDA